MKKIYILFRTAHTSTLYRNREVRGVFTLKHDAIVDMLHDIGVAMAVDTPERILCDEDILGIEHDKEYPALGALKLTIPEEDFHGFRLFDDEKSPMWEYEWEIKGVDVSENTGPEFLMEIADFNVTPISDL